METWSAHVLAASYSMDDSYPSYILVYLYGSMKMLPSSVVGQKTVLCKNKKKIICIWVKLEDQTEKNFI